MVGQWVGAMALAFEVEVVKVLARMVVADSVAETALCTIHHLLWQLSQSLTPGSTCNQNEHTCTCGPQPHQIHLRLQQSFSHCYQSSHVYVPDNEWLLLRASHNRKLPAPCILEVRRSKIHHQCLPLVQRRVIQNLYSPFVL